MNRRNTAITLAMVIVAAILIGCGKHTAKESGPTSRTTKPVKTPPTAEKPAPTGVQATKELTADEIIDKMITTYKSIKTFQMTADVTHRMSMGSRKRVSTSRASIKYLYLRPNKIRFDTTGKTRSVTVICDGKNVYVYQPQMKVYQKIPMPKNVSDVLPGTQSFIAGLLLDSSKVKSMIENPKLLPSEKIAGVDTYVIQITKTTPSKELISGSTISKMFWIGKKDFLVRQVSSSSKIQHTTNPQLQSPGSPKGTLYRKEKLVVSETKVNAPIPASTFRFTPPPGAKLFGMPKPPPPLTEGSKAPGFSIKDLNGKQVSLSDYRGKPVLVVFWAVASKTAKEGMPEIEKVYNDLKGKGVVMLGISLDMRSAKSEVEKFVKESPITFPILFGWNEAIKAGNDYGRGPIGLPTIFVVGGDGAIKGKINGHQSSTSIESELAKLGIK